MTNLLQYGRAKLALVRQTVQAPITTQKREVPSGFGIMKTGEHQGLLPGR